MEELRPGWAAPHRRRIEGVLPQDGPDARRGKDDAHRGQLALDAAIAPGRVLPGQSENHRHRSGWDTRPPRTVGLSPLAADQVPVPAEQGLGLHEESTSTSSVHESTQSGDQRSIRWTEYWASDLATKNGDLVTEHDDLDGQIVAVTVTQTD